MSTTGLVVATHGRHATVEADDGTRLRCHPRGKKLEVVVGDRVLWAAAGDEGVIESVQDRRNLMYRQDEWRTKSFAANLDLILVLVAGEPIFSEAQLARALIAAEHAGIPALIGQNKTDLPTAEFAKLRLEPYVAMGTEVLQFSLKGAPDAARTLLTDRLRGHHTLVLGASGMGKSTLINLLVPQAAAEVGEISTALKAGRHTTTYTRWYWLEQGRHSAVIDSPGFQEFGLRQLAPPQLAQAMPDLRPYIGRCRFANCTHRHEPGCAVTEATAAGHISARRMKIYEDILAELEVKRW